MNKPRETDLYPPLKTFLEGQGYEVKSEIGAADVVAVRGEEAPLVVELKLSFSLALLHQCIARQMISDTVYMAVEHQRGKRFARALKSNIGLARRLGLGVITVRLSDGHLQVHCDPAPFVPRKSKQHRENLLREFARREGDPNQGGQNRVGLVTAYRQDALKCAAFLANAGPSRGAEVARNTAVSTATRIMRDNHYGWFERVSVGVYRLTDAGVCALK